MSERLLPSDNLSLSQVTIFDFAHFSEITFTAPVPSDVAGYVGASLSDNTHRAYRSDVVHFESWGGRIPASPTTVASYLAAHAETLSVATLVRRVATISKVHQAKDLSNPCRSELVRATLRGIKRTFGTAHREAKPLLREDLFLVLDGLGSSMKDAPDRALLLIGFAGGFRRSELVGLNWSDVERVRQGIIINLRRSKTDQESVGRKLGIPYGRTRNCPVAALDKWKELSKIEHGPVSRRRPRPRRLPGKIDERHSLLTGRNALPATLGAWHSTNQRGVDECPESPDCVEKVEN
jgi:integrase